jgi:hypothetical protein
MSSSKGCIGMKWKNSGSEMIWTNLYRQHIIRWKHRLSKGFSTLRRVVCPTEINTPTSIHLKGRCSAEQNTKVMNPFSTRAVSYEHAETTCSGPKTTHLHHCCPYVSAWNSVHTIFKLLILHLRIIQCTANLKKASTNDEQYKYQNVSNNLHHICQLLLRGTFQPQRAIISVT